MDDKAEPKYAPHPNENHEFDIICSKCGQYGMLNVALITPDEKVSIQTMPSPRPEED
jgi:hypothetical protein